MEKEDKKHRFARKCIPIKSPGPIDIRKNTDTPCLFFFIVLNIIFILLSIYGKYSFFLLFIPLSVIKENAIERLTHGIDFRGEVCG